MGSLLHLERTKSRRVFLATLPGVMGASLFGLSASCSRNNVFSCTSTTGLSPSELEIRHKLGYTDTAPKPELACSECAQYVEAQADGCGGCKVMPGPTHPDGYCKVFQAKG